MIEGFTFAFLWEGGVWWVALTCVIDWQTTLRPTTFDYLTLVLFALSLSIIFVVFDHRFPVIWRAFQSGFEPEPVMCQTVNMTMANQYCLWASCGEWCLTKTSGFCPQMHATVRRNGTDIRLENCTRITETECKQVKVFH